MDVFLKIQILLIPVFIMPEDDSTPVTAEEFKKFVIKTNRTFDDIRTQFSMNNLALRKIERMLTNLGNRLTELEKADLK